MSLPSQEQKESYTPDEVQHLIAREWAKQEIISLKNRHLELQRQLIDVTGTFHADSKALREMLTSFPTAVADQISQCRKDLRHEIEQDFPSKLEAMRMEQRIEEKIGETDKTLGKQISELDKKMDSNSADLANQIRNVDNKVERQALKIAAVVGTIVAIGGITQWFFATGRHLVGG